MSLLGWSAENVCQSMAQWVEKATVRRVVKWCQVRIRMLGRKASMKVSKALKATRELEITADVCNRCDVEKPLSLHRPNDQTHVLVELLPTRGFVIEVAQ